MTHGPVEVYREACARVPAHQRFLREEMPCPLFKQTLLLTFPPYAKAVPIVRYHTGEPVELIDHDEMERRVAEALAQTHDQYREFSVKLGATAHPRIVLARADEFTAGWKYRRVPKG